MVVISAEDKVDGSRPSFGFLNPFVAKFPQILFSQWPNILIPKWRSRLWPLKGETRNFVPDI